MFKTSMDLKVRLRFLKTYIWIVLYGCKTMTVRMLEKKNKKGLKPLKCGTTREY